MFNRTRMLPRGRFNRGINPQATQATTTTPAQAAAPAAAALPKEVIPMTQPNTPRPVSQYQDVDTQPLWYRMKVAAGALAGGVSVDAFTTKRNAAPHLTNCEESGAMPNSAEFYVSGIELVPNAGTDATALALFLANTRLVMEVGTKNYEKVNQPAVLFHSAGISLGTGLDNGAKIGQGLYTLKAGEEIKLAADQPFRVRFVTDDDGVTTAAAIDFFVVLRGQKRSRVSVG